MVLGLVTMAIGLYGVYELSQTVKYTTKDLTIQQGTGTLIEQKKKIDKDFINIIDYSGAKCKIKNNKVVDATPSEYGNMELYLMEKGYSKDAIEYCKNKYDNIAFGKQQQYNDKIDNEMLQFENALQNKKSKEMAIPMKENKYITKQKLDEIIQKRLEYLHNHHNENARINIIMNGAYDFDVIYIIKVPSNQIGKKYIKNLVNKIQ